MKPIKFDGTDIAPEQIKPWMVYVKSATTHTLYGLSFYAAKPNGCACQEGFDAPDLDDLAEGAYVKDVMALPAERSGLLLERGPVVDTQLPELTIQTLNMKTSFPDIESALLNKSLLDKFTTVSLDIFAGIWKVMGAKIGRRINKNIEWQRPYIYSEPAKLN